MGDLLVGGDHVARRVLGPTHAQRGHVLVVERHLERLVVGGRELEELPMGLEFLVEVGRRRVYPIEAIMLALVVCHAVLHAQLAVRGVLSAKGRAVVSLALIDVLILDVAQRGVLLGRGLLGKARELGRLIPCDLDGTPLRFDRPKSVHGVLGLPLWLSEPLSDELVALGALRLIKLPKPCRILVSVANESLNVTDMAALERALLALSGRGPVTAPRL